MTEAKARQLLRDCGGFGGLEAWIAGRRWNTAPGGWTVPGELQGWQFWLEVIPAGLRISASVPGGPSGLGRHRMNGQRTWSS